MYVYYAAHYNYYGVYGYICIFRVGFCVARFDKLDNARAFDVRRAEKMYEPLTLFLCSIFNVPRAAESCYNRMEINDFIKKFAAKFEDTDESEFTPETEFQELDEWDSMTALMIIALIRTEYDKKVTAIEIRNCKTIKDLYDLAEAK